jgi:hypothetical protein
MERLGTIYGGWSIPIDISLNEETSLQNDSDLNQLLNGNESNNSKDIKKIDIENENDKTNLLF